MKKAKICLLVVCLSFLFSCTKETEIGNEIIDSGSIYKKTPVVLSLFSSDSLLTVEFGTTKPPFNIEDDSKLTEVTDPIIKDLKTETFYSLERCSDYENKYSIKINFAEGAVYQIGADFLEIGNERVLATDTIPYASKIESIEITPDAKRFDNDLSALVQLEILPSTFQKKSYYEISVVTAITDTIDFNGFPIDSVMLIPSVSQLSSDNFLITKEDYYPSVLQFDAFLPTSLFFNKETNAGTFFIDFYYSLPMSSSTNMSTGETTIHTYSHTATIFFKTVSSNYYQYNVSRLKQFYSRKGDPLYGVGDPVNVYTNVENGTGIFASYTCDTINYYNVSE